MLDMIKAFVIGNYAVGLSAVIFALILAFLKWLFED